MRVLFSWLSVDMTFALASLPGNKTENLSKTERIEKEKAGIYFDLQINRIGLKVKVLETFSKFFQSLFLLLWPDWPRPQNLKEKSSLLESPGIGYHLFQEGLCSTFLSIVVMKDSDPKSPSGRKAYRFNFLLRQSKQELEAEIKEGSWLLTHSQTHAYPTVFYSSGPPAPK